MIGVLSQDLVTIVDVPKIVGRNVDVPIHQVVEIPQVIEVQNIEQVPKPFLVQNRQPAQAQRPQS